MVTRGRVREGRRNRHKTRSAGRWTAVSAAVRVVLVVDGRVRHRGRVVGRARLVDDRVEPVVVVGGVGDFPGGAVRLDQAVLAFDHVAVPLFPLVLDVAGVVVLDAVVERIFGRRLSGQKNEKPPIGYVLRFVGLYAWSTTVNGLFRSQCYRIKHGARDSFFFFVSLLLLLLLP